MNNQKDFTVSKMSALKEVGTGEEDVESLMEKVTRLKHEKQRLIAELAEMKKLYHAEEEILTKLQMDSAEREAVLRMKKELQLKMNLQCHESEQDSNRQLDLNKRHEELLQLHKCTLQEMRMMHRKQKMKVDCQMMKIIDQHKKLNLMFAPERLPQEIQLAEETNNGLLATELTKLEQLNQLEQQCKKLQSPQQDITTT